MSRPFKQPCYFLGLATSPEYAIALAKLTTKIKNANKTAETEKIHSGYRHHVRIVQYKTGKTGLYWREEIVLSPRK